MQVEAYSHMRSWCSDSLQYKLFAATIGAAKTMVEAGLLKEIKILALMKINTTVHVKEFLEMCQDHNKHVS